MNKPISKHALRRAMTKVNADGFIEFTEPIGTVVDRLWHEIGKKTYRAPRKKSVSRETVRIPAVPEPSDVEMP